MTTTMPEHDWPEVEEQARAFFADYPPRRRHDRFEWGVGDDRAVAIWDDPDPEEERHELEVARAYRRARFAAGLGWLEGPTELGGRGLPRAAQHLVDRIEAEREVPTQAFFKLDRVLGPILREHADPQVAARLERGLFTGELIACELFSEPGAGSDLASLRTRATRTTSGWTVSGQKVWTSDAHYADVGLALCRTEPGSAGRQGLSALIIDMHHPGVEVRPLRQMTGGASFNEVFLTDVPVPEEHLVGRLGQGWRIAQETLLIERQAIGTGLGRGGAGVANGQRLSALVQHLGLADDPVVRQRLAEVHAGFRTARSLDRITRSRRSIGDTELPSPMLSKLALSRNLRLTSRFLIDVLGPRLAADTGEWGTFAWKDFVLGEPGMHIMAGTDEVVRSMIGERDLDLPRDPRPESTGAPR